MSDHMMDRLLNSGSMLKRDNNNSGCEGATGSTEKTLTHQSKRKNSKYCDLYVSFGVIRRGCEASNALKICKVDQSESNKTQYISSNLIDRRLRYIHFSEKYFIIEVKDGDQCMLSVEKVNETYYDIGFKMNKITSYRTPLDGLDVYVLLE
ncbi:Hypothetical predicted protein [Octopus vulgaris]|uniref:Uncharacterized protein n=1 Tax=Octopus vulgaris TaxID=6645 RepID=A0AA36B342_OCTVU|nr:Hypothetical predicted protein [Octopus vulgaris]